MASKKSTKRAPRKGKDTGEKQARAGKNGNVPPVAHRFRKGKGEKGDPRINRKGRPKSFDALRALVQEIGAEDLGGEGLTRIAAKIRMMYVSKNSGDNAILLSYGWGKVPDEVKQDGHVTLRVVWDEAKPGPDDSPAETSPAAATDSVE